jgi:quinol monooxygenase YgiN
MTSRLSPIVELRQYDLVPGTRETLIDIFDRHFIESQEGEGMAVIGQFRDLDNPDSFVWLRGFADMASRKRALAGFYGGPVWSTHRDAANATMLRFDNVLLLRPAWPDAGFALDMHDRPAAGPADHPAPEAGTQADTLVTANVITVRDDADAFAAWHRQHMLPILTDAGVDVVAAFVTESAENDYPALPVRTDGKVLVIFSRFAGQPALDSARLRLAASPAWAAASKAAAPYVQGPPQTLRLQPTARSLLR